MKPEAEEMKPEAGGMKSEAGDMRLEAGLGPEAGVLDLRLGSGA